MVCKWCGLQITFHSINVYSETEVAQPGRLTHFWGNYQLRGCPGTFILAVERTLRIARYQVGFGSQTSCHDQALARIIFTLTIGSGNHQ